MKPKIRAIAFKKKHEKKFVKLCLHLGYTVQKENIWRIYFDWKFKIVILRHLLALIYGKLKLSLWLSICYGSKKH